MYKIRINVMMKDLEARFWSIKDLEANLEPCSNLSHSTIELDQDLIEWLVSPIIELNQDLIWSRLDWTACVTPQSNLIKVWLNGSDAILSQNCLKLKNDKIDTRITKRNVLIWDLNFIHPRIWFLKIVLIFKIYGWLFWISIGPIGLIHL